MLPHGARKDHVWNTSDSSLPCFHIAQGKIMFGMPVIFSLPCLHIAQDKIYLNIMFGIPATSLPCCHRPLCEIYINIMFGIPVIFLCHASIWLKARSCLEYQQFFSAMLPHSSVGDILKHHIWNTSDSTLPCFHMAQGKIIFWNTSDSSLPCCHMAQCKIYLNGMFGIPAILLCHAAT